MTYAIPVFLYTDSLLATNLRVEDYVIHHPRCRRAHIAQVLEVSADTVSQALSKLAKQGRVRRVKIEGEWVWEEGPEEGFVPKEVASHGVPSQKTVSTWVPVKAGDPLVDLFFGRAA